jgi:hypothetical protein
MNNITTNIIDDMKVIDTEDKKVVVNLNQKLSAEDLMAIESIRKLKNPFRMIGVNTVMKDLNICKTVAYRLFQRDDFPSINIGKSNQVMILAYMIWKMNKRV